MIDPRKKFNKIRDLWLSLPGETRGGIVSLFLSLVMILGAFLTLTGYARQMDKSSRTTWAAIISPAAPGTKGVLAGACRPFSSITEGMGVSAE